MLVFQCVFVIGLDYIKCGLDRVQEIPCGIRGVWGRLLYGSFSVVKLPPTRYAPLFARGAADSNVPRVPQSRII